MHFWAEMQHHFHKNLKINWEHRHQAKSITKSQYHKQIIIHTQYTTTTGDLLEFILLFCAFQRCKEYYPVAKISFLFVKIIVILPLFISLSLSPTHNQQYKLFHSKSYTHTHNICIQTSIPLFGFWMQITETSRNGERNGKGKNNDK